ncbi:uncharacterized protein LOC117327393 isoform X2 [Pecten maximus]|uniref:uncharacterized protein LOC117327393 isoform X2 n=1 Tax=Pecten maximus TaxID=6579 RepID=UPI0014590B46|nr:uncharacterized protein LOC117327393 isoform X2 [Pecten maximus]
MRMDCRLSFAVVFLNIIVSPVLSASTTSSNENVTSITTESSTLVPISNETSTLPPNDNVTTATLPVHNSTIPMTIEPSDNYTGSTVIPQETTSSKPIPIQTTVPLPKTTSAASSGFDGGSFAGGIALGAVLALILLGVLYYCRRRTGYSNLSS